MADASSIRKARTSLPAASTNKAKVRYYEVSNQPVVSNGESWKPLIATKTFQVTSKDLATNCFFIATELCKITGISYIHSTAESTATTLTVNVTKDTGTQAAGAGTAVLTSAFTATTTANTAQHGTLVSTNPDVVFVKAGERLSIKLSATATELVGVTLTVTLERQNNTVDIVKSGATALVSQCIFVALYSCKVVAIKEWHAVAGTDSSAVTMDVTKDVVTDAPGAGTTVMTAPLSLKATAKTVQSGTLSLTPSVLVLAKGDRLSLLKAGTTTAVSGMVFSIAIQPMDSNVSFVTINQNLNGVIGTTGVLVATGPCVVDAMAESHATAGNDGGGVTFTITKSTGTQAPGTGTALLSSAINVKATANTPQYGSLITTNYPALNLAKGDRLSITSAGVLATLAGLTMTVAIKNF